ncbi:hypothetical protein AB0H12_19120 [Actinosynnema sp. NPDC023794]
MASDELSARDRDRAAKPMEDEDVRGRLAFAEVRVAAEAMSTRRAEFGGLDGFVPDQERLSAIREDIVAFYAGVGVHVGDVPVRVVRTLPEPYASKGFSALTADLGDWKRHGVEPGIYFLESALQPLFTEYFVAHEIVHVWLGLISPDDSCTILEEGLAEYLSIFGYIGHRYGASAARKLHRLYRLNSSANSRFESYVDGLKQLLFVIDAVGGDAEVLAIARGGRAALNEAFQEVLAGAAEQPSGGGVQPDVLGEGRASAKSLVLAVPRSLVVSASAYQVAVVARDGMTVRELAHDTGMSLTAVDAGLRELDGRALITLRKAGQVVSRNLALEHVERGHLRYDFRDAGSV